MAQVAHAVRDQATPRGATNEACRTVKGAPRGWTGKFVIAR